MANIAQGGFRFKRMKNGSTQYKPFLLPVVTGNVLGIFRGDAVKRQIDGTAYPAVAGDKIVGICDGAARYRGSDGVIRKGGSHLPAATTYSGGIMSEECSFIRIIPAEGALFEVDADDGVTATTLAAYQALVGENTDLAVGAGGNTSTGVSSHSLDISLHAALATLVFRIEEIATRLDNDPTTTNTKLIVSVNLSQDPFSSALGLA